MQYYGGEALDAALLLIPQIGFLPPRRPARRGHRRGDRARALRRTGSCMRYTTKHVDDGSAAPEGAFLACSFWLADAYVMLGPPRRRDARCSSACSTLRNDLGLLAEEYDPRREAPARQLSARLLAHRPRQHGVQSREGARPGAAARRAQRTTSDYWDELIASGQSDAA